VVAGLTLAGASAVSHDLYVGVFRHGRANEKEEMRVAKAATVSIGVISILLGLLFQKQNVAFMVGLAFAVASSANFPALLMSVTWKRFTTAGAIASIYTGLALAVVLIFLSPTVWEDVCQAHNVTARTATAATVTRLEAYQDPIKATADLKLKVTDLGATLAAPDLNAKIRASKAKELEVTKGDLAVLEGGSLAAALEAARSAKAMASASVSAAPFPMKNPGVFSIGGAFLVGILVSLFRRERSAEELFESEKVRTYVGIGAEGAGSH